MKDIGSVNLGRRDLLKGALAIAGAALFGIETPAAADTSSTTSISYWNGVTFVNPVTLAPEAYLDATGAHFTVGGHFLPGDTSGTLAALTAYCSVAGASGSSEIPFYAWANKQSSTHAGKFFLSVSAQSGLVFSVGIGNASGTQEYYYLTTNSSVSGPKLRKGTYVIAVGSPLWAGYALHDGCIVNRGTGRPDSSFEYILLSVS